MSAHSFCLEKCGLDVTQPKCLIKSSLAPLAPSPPWIGKVQCNGVHAKHSGPIRARAVGSYEPTRQQNYQTNPISSNPKGINGLQLVSSTAGRSDPSNPTDRPAGYKGSFAAGREAPKEQHGGRACSADLALFQRPRPSAATEQQNDQTNQIPHKVLFSRHLRRVWRPDRVLRPSAGEKCGLVHHVSLVQPLSTIEQSRKFC